MVEATDSENIEYRSINQINALNSRMKDLEARYLTVADSFAGCRFRMGLKSCLNDSSLHVSIN